MTPPGVRALDRRTLVFGLLAMLAGPLLLWALLRRAGIGIEDIPPLIGGLRVTPIVVVAIGTAFQVVLAGEKWRLVEIRLADRQPSRRRAIAYSMIGNALGQIMPPAIASAVVRGGGNHLSAGVGGVRGALTSVWEQLFDFAIMILLLVPSLAAAALSKPAVFLASAPIVLLVGDRLCAPIIEILSRRLRLPQALADPSLSRLLYRLSVVRFCLLIVVTWAVADAARFEVPFAALASTIAPVTAASILSFLPAGIGVNEWSFLFLLSAFGAPMRAIAGFSVVNRILIATVSIGLGLIGGLLLSGRSSTAELPDDAK